MAAQWATLPGVDTPYYGVDGEVALPARTGRGCFCCCCCELSHHPLAPTGRVSELVERETHRVCPEFLSWPCSLT
jgi:hypothetical protein